MSKPVSEPRTLNSDPRAAGGRVLRFDEERAPAFSSARVPVFPGTPLEFVEFDVQGNWFTGKSVTTVTKIPGESAMMPADPRPCYPFAMDAVVRHVLDSTWEALDLNGKHVQYLKAEAVDYESSLGAQYAKSRRGP